jgi:hypothetical protein
MPWVPTFPWTILLALGACLATPIDAAPQEPPTTDLPVSLDRIREELAKPPGTGLKLDMSVHVPVATFKTRVDQRRYVLTLEEWLAKEFEMTVFERQSAAWAAKCCGIGLDPLLARLDKALQRRKVRKIREQIARELAELEAARTKAAPSNKR